MYLQCPRQGLALSMNLYHLALHFRSCYPNCHMLLQPHWYQIFCSSVKQNLGYLSRSTLGFELNFVKRIQSVPNSSLYYNKQFLMERSQATGGSTVLLEEQKQQPEIVTFTVKPKKGGIKWTEDTIDNEHMNKKKSKICCQYNKPSEHGCCSDSDSSDDEHDERNTYDRPPKHMRKAEKQQKQSEGHEHGHECQH